MGGLFVEEEVKEEEEEEEEEVEGQEEGQEEKKDYKWSSKKVQGLFKKQDEDAPEYLPKTKKSGENSASIEETNRIRASLGLKPLKP